MSKALEDMEVTLESGVRDQATLEREELGARQDNDHSDHSAHAETEPTVSRSGNEQHHESAPRGEEQAPAEDRFYREPKNGAEVRINRLLRKADGLASALAEYGEAGNFEFSKTASYQQQIDRLTAVTKSATERLRALESAESQKTPQRTTQPTNTGSQEHLAGVRARYGDYDQVIASAKGKTLPGPAVQAAQLTGKAPEIAYFLAKNPAIADQMAAAPDKGVGIIQEISRRIDSDNQAHTQHEQGFRSWTQKTTAALERLGSEGQRLHKQKLTPLPPAVAGGVLRAMIAAPDGNGHDVYVHLLRNPEKVAELASMDPSDAYAEVRHIGRALAQPRGKAVSRAPAPITPVNTHHSGGLSDEDLFRNDPDGYMRKRNREESEARRKGTYRR